MKFHLLSILIFIASFGYSQDKYITRTGEVSFEASVPSFEEVKAKSESVTAIINTENNEFAALVLVKGFRFKNALMEEHFNESYAESDKYPKATFKGHIKEANNDYFVDGELTFHGKSKRLENLPISYSKKEDRVDISGYFTVNVSDFDIKIPKIVQNKVAERVNVSFNFQLNKKK